VHEVEHVPQVAAEPVEGVQDDRVSGSGVLEQSDQARPVCVGSGLLVGVDALGGHSGARQGVELALKALLGR
jgi:hypothetical protein